MDHWWWWCLYIGGFVNWIKLNIIPQRFFTTWFLTKAPTRCWFCSLLPSGHPKTLHFAFSTFGLKRYMLPRSLDYSSAVYYFHLRPPPPPPSGYWFKKGKTYLLIIQLAQEKWIYVWGMLVCLAHAWLLEPTCGSLKTSSLYMVFRDFHEVISLPYTPSPYFKLGTLSQLGQTIR